MAPKTRSSAIKSPVSLTHRPNPRNPKIKSKSTNQVETPGTSLSAESSPPSSDDKDDDQNQFQDRTVKDMLQSPLNEKSGLRGRNVEDLGELEEQGLLRRTTSSESEFDSTRRRGKGKEKELEGNGNGNGFRLERFVEGDGAGEGEGEGGLKSLRDRQAFALLVLLYLLQGIPLGLTFGTLPYLLKQHLSYSQLAIFALATWPYSLKLLWSPIVDAWFVPKWGRRKSWIVPAQAVVGVGLWGIGGRIDSWLENDTLDIRFLTVVFGGLILAAATQDIAVDGWALTLLSPPNLSYASTAQTIGLGIGSASAFTVFLAFNSADFSNKYFRSTPLPYGLVSLGGYLRFWALVFLLVTIGLAFFKTEDPVGEDDPDMDVGKVYRVMWSIVRLKNIQSFLIIHLICKIGFQVNDSVTGLKLLEKGLSKEDLAVAALLDFPAQMLAGWLAAKWSRPDSTSRKHALTGSGSGTGEVLRPWLWAFWARLTMATVAVFVVWCFPKGEVGSGYFGIVVMTMLFSSVASTVQFVGITAFHTQIADPLIGGTYMTLLNTISNLGGTLPKPIILRSIDLLTIANCHISKTGQNLGECVTEPGKHMCESQGGTCVVERDGYYIMSFICISLGVGLLGWFILPTVRRLQGLPMSAWRVKIPR